MESGTWNSTAVRAGNACFIDKFNNHRSQHVRKPLPGYGGGGGGGRGRERGDTPPPLPPS